MPHKGSYGSKTGKALAKARAVGKAMHKKMAPRSMKKRAK